MIFISDMQHEGKEAVSAKFNTLEEAVLVLKIRQ
jgi:hypothetical protein